MEVVIRKVEEWNIFQLCVEGKEMKEFSHSRVGIPASLDGPSVRHGPSEDSSLP